MSILALLSPVWSNLETEGVSWSDMALSLSVALFYLLTCLFTFMSVRRVAYMKLFLPAMIVVA